MQSTNSIFLIKPKSFGFNKQTSVSNSFQSKLKITDKEINKKVDREFNQMANTLIKNGIEVLIIEDSEEPKKPDAIFPNNWISTHQQGVIILYPMMAKNRRVERRGDIVTILKKKYKVKSVLDLSVFENENKFLEGTGSVILDRVFKKAYACLSPRTNKELFKEYCQHLGYEAIYFNAVDENRKKIYHTNVMMTLGTHFAVVCLEAIQSKFKRRLIIEKLQESNREVIEISQDQTKHFAGNMLELKNSKNEILIVMSRSALSVLDAKQRKTLKKHGKLLPINIKTIETIGGGSVRCMIAENFLPQKR